MCKHCNLHVRVVEAESIADYLSRYYKPDRITATLQRAYEIELEVYGFVVTSHYDNVTGGWIAWPRFEEWSEGVNEKVEREIELREKDPVINPQVRAIIARREPKKPEIDPFD